MRSTLSGWEVELGQLVEAVSRPLRAQGAAAHVPALRDRVDWTRRSQECSADGGAACTWRL